MASNNSVKEMDKIKPKIIYEFAIVDTVSKEQYLFHTNTTDIFGVQLLYYLKQNMPELYEEIKYRKIDELLLYKSNFCDVYYYNDAI